MYCVQSSGAVVDDSAKMAANDDWAADMSVASSVAACRSIDSSSLYVVRSDSDCAYDSRQPDSGAREVGTNAREVATKPKREQSVGSHVQKGNGKSLSKRIRLSSLIERHHFDRNRQLFPIHESYHRDGQYGLPVSQTVGPSNTETDDSNCLEGYDSANSDTASLMTVAGGTWEGANNLSHRYTPVSSNSDVSPMENTSHGGSVVHSIKDDTVILEKLEKVDSKSTPTEHTGTYKSTSMMTGTSEKTTPSPVERGDHSVIRHFLSPLVSKVPNFKSTAKTPTQVERSEYHWIIDREKAEFEISTNKNDIEDDVQEESRAQARKEANENDFFGLQCTDENFMSHDMNTSAEVARPKNQVVRSLLDDDGPAEDDLTMMSDKKDDLSDVQENSRAHARKRAKDKGVFGLLRARSKSKKNVDKYSVVATENFEPNDMNASAEVAKPKNQVVRCLFDGNEPVEDELIMTSNKNDVNDIPENSRAHARKTSNGKGVFGLRLARSKSKKNVDADESTDECSVVVVENFKSNDMNTSAKVTKPKRRVVKSLFDDDGPVEDELTMMTNKNDNIHDVQENIHAHARKSPKGKGVFGFRRALSKSKKNVNADEPTYRCRPQSPVSFVENDTVIVRNTYKEKNEGVEACPQKKKSPRGKSALPGWEALTRMRSRSGSLGKKSRKNVAEKKPFTNQMCAEGYVESPLMFDNSIRVSLTLSVKLS